MKSNAEKSEVIRKALEGQDIFLLKEVTQINHQPHPYTIGTKHIEHASRFHGGMLGEATVKAIPCAHPYCNLSYDQHTSNTVGFLQLLRNTTQEEAQRVLKALVDTIGTSLVEGFVFVDTDDKYRIA